VISVGFAAGIDSTGGRVMDDRSLRERRYVDLGLWTDDRIGDLISQRAQRFPDRELFTFEDFHVSYGQFDAWVTRVAARMVACGVGRGDRVIVKLPNCLEALVLQAAAFRIGAVNVPMIPIYREYETRQIISDARPAAIAVGHALGSRRPFDEVDAVLADLGHTPAVKFVVGGEATGWTAVPGLPQPSDAEGRRVELPEPADADQPALLLYTSGTTSAPKGAYLTSRALFAQLRNMAAIGELDETTVVAAGTPLSHLGGFIAGLVLPAFLGARSVILPAWCPDDAVEVIERERVTLMMGATVFLQDLVDRYAAGGGHGHRLSNYMCAGATIPARLVRAAQEVGVNATRNYGMTETAGICTGANHDHPIGMRADWDGHLLSGMEIEAVDGDHRPLGDDCVGELRIRGPQLFDGYTDAGITRAQFDDDGWFYPGDIGVVAGGWVRMTGRSKDIVNRGGEKFSTQDIEMALIAHNDLAAVAVTAVPDARFGETVGAWVVLAPGVGWQGPEPYLRHLDDLRLAKSKLPTEWHVVDAIPMSASGKVQKFQLAGLVDRATANGVRLGAGKAESIQ
jgi:acyl-CoA synthetase